MMHVLDALIIGVGATLCIDLWGLLLRRLFGIRSLDLCLLGRWVLHMPEGTFVHESIAASSARRGECPMGWIAHYSIGVGLVWFFLQLAPDAWLVSPTVLPALGFGVVTVLVPFFTLQPALGLGVASSRTRNPNAARLKSVLTHTVFGLGLYVSAWLAQGKVG